MPLPDRQTRDGERLLAKLGQIGHGIHRDRLADGVHLRKHRRNILQQPDHFRGIAVQVTRFKEHRPGIRKRGPPGCRIAILTRHGNGIAGISDQSEVAVVGRLAELAG